ncbi:MAG: hypothetical protein AAF734_11460, partial [Bacteroidota bacterium]
IFYVLSMIEKPIWGYLYKSKLFPKEKLMRQIHGQLKRLITLLPPTMIVSMFSSLMLIVYQAFTLKSTPALILAVFFVTGLGYLIIFLKRRIDGVKQIDSDEEYIILNTGVIRLAQLHHEGLLLAFTSFILQLWVVSSSPII